MKREIHTNHNTEGLMYDLERARKEGLYEEMVIEQHVTEGMLTDVHEVKVTPELFEALQSALDLGVNVEPGEMQTVVLHIDYEYVYGKVTDDE